VLGPGNNCDFSYRCSFVGDLADLNDVLTAATGRTAEGEEVFYSRTLEWNEKMNNQSEARDPTGSPGGFPTDTVSVAEEGKAATPAAKLGDTVSSDSGSSTQEGAVAATVQAGVQASLHVNSAVSSNSASNNNRSDIGSTVSLSSLPSEGNVSIETGSAGAGAGGLANRIQRYLLMAVGVVLLVLIAKWLKMKTLNLDNNGSVVTVLLCLVASTLLVAYPDAVLRTIHKSCSTTTAICTTSAAPTGSGTLAAPKEKAARKKCPFVISTISAVDKAVLQSMGSAGVNCDCHFLQVTFVAWLVHIAYDLKRFFSMCYFFLCDVPVPVGGGYDKHDGSIYYVRSGGRQPKYVYENDGGS
jgi:hypothetical protein